MQLPVLGSHPGCTACELHSQSPGIPKTVGMATTIFPSLPATPETPAIVVIGQNPGQNEDAQGEPFVGFTGRKVRLGYLPGPKLHEVATIYLTNAVRCFTVGNGEPPTKSLSACAPHTVQDLEEIAAFHSTTYVLCMGAVAIKSFLKFMTAQAAAKATQKDAFRLNGLEFPLPSGRLVRFYGTYHPMAAEHQRHLRMVIVDHISMLAAHIRNQAPIVAQPAFVPPRSPIRD